MIKNEVRIIGGKYKSRKLKFPDIKELRPSPDMVRETLFNWLSGVVEDARCLDLFAGSGALGFEALSRGARETVFVEKNKEVVKQLKNNKELLKCNNAIIYEESAQMYLNHETKPFDIVFLDPPFHKELVTQACKLLSDRKLLNGNALVYIESEATKDGKPAFKLPDKWKIIKQKKTGNVNYFLVETMGLNLAPWY